MMGNFWKSFVTLSVSQVEVKDGLALAGLGIAKIGRPEHLVSLSNGDILFIDSGKCVRKVMVARGKKWVRTLFGKWLIYLSHCIDFEW